MIQSTGIDFWPMRPKPLEERWLIGLRGGSAMTTSGSAALAGKKYPALGCGQDRHNDLVLCNFTADRPNQLWLTDITGIRRQKANSTSARSKTTLLARLSGISYLYTNACPH